MSKEEVSKLKSVRGSYKGHCTQDIKKAERVMAAEDADVIELTAIKDRLARRLQEVTAMDMNITLQLETPTEIERDTEEALLFQDNVSLWILKISKFIEKSKPPVRQYHNSSSAEPNMNSIHINLPKINLKPFSGNALEWQTFWECFRAAIHDNTNLRDIEKMTYLNGMLKGEAARVLTGLPLTTENYAKAIELLKERFGCKQQLINAHMEALLNIHATTMNTTNLREFYDTCETNIRGLETLGVKTESYGNLLIPILLKKLPEEMTRLIFGTNPAADSSVDELRTALRKEIETREKSHATTSDEVLVPTAGALLTGAIHKTQSSKSPNKVTAYACVYCKGTHRAHQCDTLKTTQERRVLLQRERRCFNCLGLRHMTTQCYSKGRCMKCKRKHHTSICEGTQKNPSESNALPAQTDTRKVSEMSEQQASTSNNTASSSKTQQTYSGTTFAVCSNNPILMQSAIVTVRWKNNQYQSRALFDTGSQRTFVTRRLKDRLNLKTVRKELLDITTFGSVETNRKSLEVVTLNLSTDKEDIEIIALVTPTICPSIPKTLQYIQIPLELKGLKLADPPDATDVLNIDVLIGNDQYGRFITGNIKKLYNESLIATETKLGWLLSGQIPKERCSDSPANTLLCQETNADPCDETKLDELLTKFWEISTIPEEDDNPTEVYKRFENTIEFNQTINRYSVRLPWKDSKHDLPTNYGLAKKRLNSLQYSLNKRNPELINKYKDQLLDQLKQGFIETVNKPSIHTGTLHYIPHFPVFKDDSATTKMRIVYDASATTNGLSLNDCLHTGPNLMQDLMTILLRFRAHQTAFTADIEKAFLQIEINVADRDATRFLWLKDVSKPANTPGNLVVYRFCRVLFGAAPSPFLLNATIQHHLNTKQSWISEDLKTSIYMDNVVSGTDSDEKALEYYAKSRDYFNEAGMNLRQWTSNSNALNLKARQDSANAEKIVKVLGIIWNSQTDKLSLSLRKLSEETNNIKKISKRTTLSLASKLFDPLGFAEPFTIKAKVMMQDLWKLSVDWDEDLPTDHKEKWMRWLRDIKQLTRINVRRAYFPTIVTETDIHIFCDSSKVAYGAVAYLSGTAYNKTYSTLLLAKSKVAPVKTQTLPRLELLAAVLGSKLSQYLTMSLQTTMKISQVTLWSDSKIVLSWISSTKPSKQQFIQNRVQTIKNITTKHSWRHCPSTSNPADLITRGIDVETFVTKSDVWYNGPSWLARPANEWPSTKDNQQEIEEEELAGMTASTNLTNVLETTSLLNVIDTTKYSTLNKLIRITALVIYFARKWRHHEVKHNNIAALDMKTALNALLKAVQHANYDDVIQKIQNQSKSKHPAITYQLGLYIDERDGLLRCRGRLHHAKLPDKAKFPILIPKESHLSILIVKATHLIVMHGGVRETLTQLRQNYWIPKGRQLIKKLINKCVTCRKVEGPPFRSVDTPPLPETRVIGSHPFRVTGIDYAGPLYVRDTRKETSKAYICLFTCAATRAIHLELVEDQTTEAFLRAFRRFGSRRGIPECIISDNAKTFKAGSQELQALKTQTLETAQSQRFLANQGIKWKFITEKAPWRGGFYKRIIGLVKRRLRKTIGKASLTFIELQTILTETEGVINSRPITFSYGEIDDGPPLTPSHFLCGYRLLTLPPNLEAQEQDDTNDPDYTLQGASSKDLTKRARYHQRIIQDFWKQWRDECLINLREHHSSQQSTKSGTSIAKKGNIVLIHDDTPRNQWKLGIITHLHTGRDGLVRSVTLRTGNRREISTPIEKLYPLEVSGDDADEKEEDLKTSNEKRPSRVAAQHANQKIKELFNQNIV